jgi:hypothetical protein
MLWKKIMTQLFVACACATTALSCAKALESPVSPANPIGMLICIAVGGIGIRYPAPYEYLVDL